MCGRYSIRKPVTKNADLVKSNIKVEDTDNYNYRNTSWHCKGNGKTWISKDRWQTSLKSRWTRWAISWNNSWIIMSKRYSGKSQKDRSFMKKAKLSFKEKRKLKRERKNK